MTAAPSIPAMAGNIIVRRFWLIVLRRHKRIAAHHDQQADFHLDMATSIAERIDSLRKAEGPAGAVTPPSHDHGNHGKVNP